MPRSHPRGGVAPILSAVWADHFRRNRDHPPRLPLIDGPQLTDEQRRVLQGSIAEFELGERSEGRHLMSFAKRYAVRVGDPDYIKAMGLFIAEENRHAQYLEVFMRIEGMSRAQRTNADSAFRFLRKLGGLESAIRVLVTAEIIAQVYYRGLRDASSSTILRAICRQILIDEKQHIVFQCQRLAMIRRPRSAFTLWRRRIGDRVLIESAIAVVWKNHGRAMRLGGFTLRRFRAQVLAKHRRAMGIADPGRYVFDDLPGWVCG